MFLTKWNYSCVILTRQERVMSESNNRMELMLYNIASNGWWFATTRLELFISRIVNVIWKLMTPWRHATDTHLAVCRFSYVRKFSSFSRFRNWNSGSLERLAGKFLAKAGKTSSYSEHYPCPAILLQFWMRMAIPSSATATMRGARRCGALVNWQRRWARCSRLGIAGMCLMRRRGCTICGAGTIIQNAADLSFQIIPQAQLES